MPISMSDLFDLAAQFHLDNFPGELINDIGHIFVTLFRQDEYEWTIQIGNWLLTTDGKLKKYHDCINWDKDYPYDFVLHKGTPFQAYEAYENWRKTIGDGKIHKEFYEGENKQSKRRFTGYNTYPAE